jgi:hypothetical protein
MIKALPIDQRNRFTIRKTQNKQYGRHKVKSVQHMKRYQSLCFLGLKSYSSLISLAIVPVITMETVLLAMADY